MSQENVETLRAVYARWAKASSGWTADFTALTSSLSWIPTSPTAIRTRGTTESGETCCASWTPWESLTIAAEWFRDAGDTVLVGVRQDGIGRSSGAPAVQRYFQIWTFRGGRVIRLEVILDEGRALKAVGLSE